MSGIKAIINKFYTKKLKSNVELKVLSTDIKRQHGYLLMHGFAINISDHDLSHVIAVCECFSANNELISKSDMLVDEMTIKPKGILAFSIAADDNPDIFYLNLSFKYLFGPEIQATGMSRLYLQYA